MEPDDLILVDPWVDLRGGGPQEAEERARLLAELRAEVVAGHPLHEVAVDVVGRSNAQDDVAFRLKDGRWAVVHLTYAHPDRPPWPSTTLYETVEALEAAVADDA